MFKSISTFIARIDTRILVNILSSIGILCIAATTLIAPKYIGNPFQDLMIAIGFLFWALTGVVSMIRRETYAAIIYLEGVPAVIIGFIVTVLSIFVASALLIGRLVHK